MPRAKVKDEDRQRAPKACIPCKSSKIRCDAKQPCARCVKNNREAECKYVDSKISAQHRSRTIARTSTTSKRSSITQTLSPRTSSIHDRSSFSKTDQNEVEDTSSQANSSAPSPEVTHSRLLLSSKGERVYVGEIASLSFLQFLRRTLRHHMGNSPFTEPPSKNVMLEAEVHDLRVSSGPDENYTEQQVLVQCYLEATSGIFDLLTKDEVYAYMQQDGLTKTNQTRAKSRLEDTSALVSLVFAIGAQCRAKDESDAHIAAKHFNNGRRLAFEGLLSDPSITMIRLFLLMTFYTLGACRRNAAFMYIGVAAKAACCLGLHSLDQYRHLSPEERGLRVRTWKSLSILDTIVSSVLGRPSSLPDSYFPAAADQVYNISNTEDLRKLAFNASYGGCSYLVLLLKQVANGNNIDPASAETFLEQLKQWSKDLPTGLRQFSASRDEVSGITYRELLIGNAHVACIYYFAVMLSTRPFLISHLVSKLQAQNGNNNSVKSSSPDHERVSKLAQVCLDAAIYMAQIANSVMESDGFFSNMCLLKALVFAAGLLLGFSLFADRDSSTNTTQETEDSFDKARAVLRHFSEQSSQARLYHQILSDFSDAIKKHRQQLVEKRRRLTNQYVDHIFTLDSSGGGGNGGSNTNSNNTNKQNLSYTGANNMWDPVNAYRRDSSSMNAQQQAQAQYLSPVSGSSAILDSSGGLTTTDGMSYNNTYDGRTGDDVYNTSQFDTGFSNGMGPFDDPMNLPLLWDDFGVDWQTFDFNDM